MCVCVCVCGIPKECVLCPVTVFSKKNSPVKVNTDNLHLSHPG